MTRIGYTYWTISIFCGAFPAFAALVFAANFGLPPLICGGAFWVAAAVFTFGWLCAFRAGGMDDERCGRDQ